MIVIPAIDIIDGKPVRLYKGQYDKKEIVGEDAVKIAEGFEKAGAKYIHIVDLDGAKEGYLINKKVIAQIRKAVTVPMEVGGGIRTYEDVEYLINNGVNRVILGTVAIEDKKLLEKSVENFKEKIAVGIDCKNGYLCGRGWINESNINYLDFIKYLESIGISNIIVTDIDKDGTLEGVNKEFINSIVKNTKIKVTASGGVRDIKDIISLNEMNIYGAIVGKSIYNGNLNLNQAIKYTNKEVV